MTNKLEHHNRISINDSQHIIEILNNALSRIGHGFDTWIDINTPIDIVHTGYSNRGELVVRDDLDIEYCMRSLEGVPIFIVMVKQLGLGTEIEVPYNIAQELNYILSQLS